ncbi:MAG: M20/M25/M40 family metallo-hydrolase [Gaiellaceae bacterium]
MNEGAGDRLVLGGHAFYVCGVAEKMTSPFTLRVFGRSGHASMPAIADNALVKAAGLIQRLGKLQVAPRLEPEVRAFLEAVAGEVPEAGEALARAAAVDPLAAEMVQPLLSFTVSPTMVEASKKRNVIPALCVVTVDCRILPGQSRDEVEAVVRESLGEADYELEWGEAQGGTRSPMGTPLWAAVASFVEETEPGARAVPLIVPGFTDSHWVRDAFGTVAYGFFPMRAMDAETAARLIHSADERVPVEDLELGVRFLRHAAMAIGDVSASDVAGGA